MENWKYEQEKQMLIRKHILEDEYLMRLYERLRDMTSIHESVMVITPDGNLEFVYPNKTQNELIDNLNKLISHRIEQIISIYDNN